MIKNKFGNYFKDDKNEITDTKEIIKKIKSINDEGNINYYSLKVPIEAFEDVSIPKDEIELIDMPRITKDLIEDPTNFLDLKLIMNLCDGFIFTFNKISVEDKDSKMIFLNIISQIKNLDEFNFENCFFVLTHKDNITDNLEDKLEDLKKEIKKDFNNLIFSGNFVERILMREKITSSQNINIFAFSNLYYQNFQKNIKGIKTLEILDNYKSLEDKLEFLEEEFGDIDIIDETLYGKEIKEIKTKIKNRYPKSDLNQKLLDKISLIIQSVLINKKNIQQYKFWSI